MKLWKYYQRIKTLQKPACIVRCVGVYPNAYVVQFEDKTIEFVSKNHESCRRLYTSIKPSENE